MKLAVIPARGGSKRIPRKNIRPFAGKPVIAWSIEAAAASGLFDRVIVSTDDAEVSAVARAHGAETPFVRPTELADDHAPTVDVIAHAAAWAADEGLDPEAICCIYPAAPMLDPGDLHLAAAAAENDGWDYVFPAARFPAPVQRGFLRLEDGGAEALFPEFMASRSQDLPPVYHDAAIFYWGSVAAWRERRPVLSPRSTFFVLPPWRVQDIDTPEDWEMAERLFRI